MKVWNLPGAYSTVELRLHLEEVCADLSCFELMAAHGVGPDAIRIDREASLGPPGTIADIRIQAPALTHPAYSNRPESRSLKVLWSRVV